jgi:hypothetical protein
MEPDINSVEVYRVIMGIQWIVRRSILLYLEGTVVPLKLIMGIHWMVGWTSECLCMEYQRGAYFVRLYFLAWLFRQPPIYCFPVDILYNGKFARCTLLKCYNAYCTLLGGQFNIHKFSIAPCQIYNFTLSNQYFRISTFTLQTWQVYIILRAAPKKFHWLPNLFLKFFLPKLCFLGRFLLGWVGGLH